MKKASILLGLFLALFFAGFYFVNVFDAKSVLKSSEKLELAKETLLKEELAKKTAKDGIDLAEFQLWVKANKLSGSGLYDGDPDEDGLQNNKEYLYGTDPKNFDTDGDKFSDKQEIINGYDPDAPGDAKPEVFVKIEKLGIDAPMIWTLAQDGETSLKDLEKGLSHFPRTASPGQIGNSVISGHSSNYVWAKGDYNYIFKNLNDLGIGDMVKIKTVQKNGKVFMFQYVVKDKFVTVADDERIFAETKNPTLTLSTCWPLGTNFKRLIVKAEMVN